MTHLGQWRCVDCRREDRRRHPRTKGSLRVALLAASGGLCSYCDRAFLPGERWHADHVRPRAEGGPHELANLVAACDRCNAGILTRVFGLLWLLDPAHAARRRQERYSRLYAALVKAGVTSASTFWERRRFVRTVLTTTTMFARTSDVPEDPTDIDRRVAHLSELALGTR
jgi:hypothetical protein